MDKEDYVAMVKKVQLHDKLGEFRIDDLERIIGWVGDESIEDSYKYWRFSFDNRIRRYPFLEMSIKVNPPNGICLVFTEYRSEHKRHEHIRGTFTTPTSLREAVNRAMMIAMGKIAVIHHQNQNVDEHWKQVIGNFKVQGKGG